MTKIENGKVVNSVIHTITRESENEKQKVDQIMLLDMALRFNPDIAVVGEMRGAEANAAQEAARTGVAVIDRAEAERFKRQRKLGRIFPDKPVEECIPATKFIMPKAGKIFNDPFKQAEYAYSLIESEVKK